MRLSRSPAWLAALIAGVLLLYGAGLTYTPPYLHEAEVLFALHAHAIATTAHDVYGRFLPLYFQMTPIGENVWFHPAIVYATAPFLLVLPFTEWVIRLPSVLVAALNVLLIYLVAFRVFRVHRHAWLAAALMAMTPAHFINSRIAMDYVYPLPFVLGWMLCLLVYLDRRSTNVLFIGGTLLGLGVYSYIASVVMMPLYLAFTWLMLYLHTDRPLRPSLVAAAGFAWPLLILPVWLYYHPAVVLETLGRYGMVNAELVTNFRGKPLADILAELRAPLRFSGVTGRVSLYWYFFDPSFLFLSGGYANVVNSTRHVGVFLLPFLVLIPFGVWRVAAEWWKPVNLLLLFGFLTAPLAACLVVPEPYAIDREMQIVPFGVLIATSAIVWLSYGVPWKRAAATVALVVALAHFVFFLGDYHLDYRGRSAFWFNRNHRGALEDIIARDTQSAAPAVYLTQRQGSVHRRLLGIRADQARPARPARAHGVFQQRDARRRERSRRQPHPRQRRRSTPAVGGAFGRAAVAGGDSGAGRSRAISSCCSDEWGDTRIGSTFVARFASLGLVPPALCLRLLLPTGRAGAGEPSGRPRPREIVAADRAEGVEHLAAEKQPALMAALQRSRVHFVERHAAAGDLRLAEPFIGRPWQDIRGQALHERRPFLAAQIGDAPIERNVRFGHERRRQPLRQLRRYRGRDLSSRCGQRRLPRPRVGPRPLHADGGLVCPRLEAAHRDMRDVEHRRTAVSAMREQEPAAHFRGSRPGARSQTHAERDAAQRRMNGGLGDERRERRIDGVDVMTERPGDRQARAVAAGGRDRQPAGGEDDARGRDVAAIGSDVPPVSRRRQADERRLELKRHAE